MFTSGLVGVAALCWVSVGRVAAQTPPSTPPGPVASQPSAEPSSDVLYTRGCARLEAGDPAAAINLLVQACARSPDNLDYALGLAKARAAAGQFPAALRLLNDLAARQPKATAVQVTLAEVHALRKDWTAVTSVLSPLEDRLGVDELVMLANAWTEMEQPARASKILERGLARWPASETLWLALIDQALDLEQCGLALQRVRRAQRHLGPSPQLEFRRAQAYYRLGQALGQTRVLRVRGGRAGQFVNDWLLVEKRAEPDRFLCCPKASALHALRRALDGGLDEPATHLLHARIWQQAGRPEVGLAILQSREALWLKNATPEMLATFADLALGSNALSDYLRYTRLRAAREPELRSQIQYDAFLAAAERYNQRGDDAMYCELLRRALALRPGNVALMLQLADAIWDAGARREAALWYRRVLEREPAHRDRSRVLKRLGD